MHLVNKLLSNNDLKNFILFHANKASIRTTLKTPTSDPTGGSSRASSADLTSTTNLESTPVSMRQENASIANSSFNSFTIPNHHHPHLKTAEKLMKNDYITLSYDFKQIDWSQEEEVPPLGSFDVIQQESLLLNDLLYVLVVSALFVERTILIRSTVVANRLPNLMHLSLSLHLIRVSRESTFAFT